MASVTTTAYDPTKYTKAYTANNQGLNRDTYLQNANQYAENTAKSNYDWQSMINNQGVQRQQQQLDSSQRNIQNQYTANQNRIGEERSALQNQYTSANNRLAEERAGQGYQYQSNRDQVEAGAAQSARRLSELLASNGLNRGGYGVSQMMGVQGQRQQGLSDINNAEALANLGYSNRAIELAGQQANDMAGFGNRTAELEQQQLTNIANLEAQRQALIQQGGDYNNALAQQMAQQIAAAKAQAAMDYENVNLAQAGLTGSYNGQQTLASQQQAQDEAFRQAQLAQEQSQFTQSQSQQAQQFGQSLAEQIAARQVQTALQQGELTGMYNGQQTLAAQQQAQQRQQWQQEFLASEQGRQFQQQLATSQLTEQQKQNALDEAYRQAQLRQEQQQFLNSQAQQAQQFSASLNEQVAARRAQDALQQGELTGSYNGQSTLAAQQLANQIAQQALANRFNEAELTGLYNGQNTLARQQQEWAQTHAADLLATELWSAYLKATPNAGVPSSAVSWINQMFTR